MKEERGGVNERDGVTVSEPDWKNWNESDRKSGRRERRGMQKEIKLLRGGEEWEIESF